VRLITQRQQKVPRRLAADQRRIDNLRASTTAQLGPNNRQEEPHGEVARGSGSTPREISALGGTLKLIADFGDEQLKIA
jgi:hypothetical protein